MTRKISVGIVFLIVIIVASISIASTYYFLIYENSKLIVDLQKKTSTYSRLESVDDLVRNEYYGEIDLEKVDENLAKGFLNGLGDDLCFYISSDTFESYQNLYNGKMPGVGIDSIFDYENDCLIVTSVHDNSSAQDAGINVGDFITKIDGKTVTEDNSKNMIFLLQDSFSGKLNVTYIPKESTDSNEEEIVLSFGYIADSCLYEIKDNVGYIKFSEFYENTVDTFRKALSEFKKENISAIILDLRNCTSYNIDVASKIIDIIVPIGNEGIGSIFQAIDSNGNIIKQFSSDAETLSLSIAVLINDRTECAAELIACDLKDFGKALLFGEKTKGVGTLQQLFTLDDGSALSLSVAEIIPYSGKTYNKVGVNPDYEILTSESFKNSLHLENFSNDEQYLRAHEYLTGK